MTEPFVYEVDGRTYLDRQNRLRAVLDRIRSAEGFDPDQLARDIVAIQREVDPIPLVIGVTYRWRLLKAAGRHEHLHVRDSAGAEFSLDLPSMDGAEFAEMQGSFAGRHSVMGGGTPLLLFFVNGAPIGLADVDVLRIEEVR